MRIGRTQNTIAFQRSLTSREEREYMAILKKAKEKINQTGKSVLILPTSSLPQTTGFNSGVGHLSSDIAQDYLKFMKTYYGINTMLDLPAGQVHNVRDFYCSYEGTALELGVHQINPELLATKEFEYLLSKDDLKVISDANTSSIKNNFANFKNVVDKGSATDKALLKAFEKFKSLDEKLSLKQKYLKFIQENDAWLNFKRSDEPNQEFFKFKQFLADEHLRIGKARTNQLGIMLAGDCPINFTKDEVEAFPNAFYKDKQIHIGEWKAKSLNFDEITNPASDAYKLLKMKIQLAAKRYDALRIDVGWFYVTPKLTDANGLPVKKEMGSQVLDLIEKWVKEIKGDYFDTKNIIYEVEADRDDFKAFDELGLIQPLKNRMKTYTTLYMKDNDWGYTTALTNKGLSLDEFILGVGNHDTQPLRQVAKGILDNCAKEGGKDHKTPAIKVLSDIFNISPSTLSNPVEFARTKFAETMLAKHNMFFFADLLGLEEAFNKHGGNKVITPERNFSIKIPTNFKEATHKAIQEGFGFNIMDSLEKIFKAKGLDTQEAKLFERIVHFKEILNSNKNKIFELTKGKIAIFASLGGVIGLLSSYAYLKYAKNANTQQKENTPKEVQIPTTNLFDINNFTKQKI